MSTYEDSRWLQRFQNFQRSLSHLDAAIKITADKDAEALSDLEKQGLIKCFEMAFELAWNTLQDYFYEQGYALEKGPRAAIQQAFKDGLIKDGSVWISMIKSRNDAAHSYDEEMANQIILKILESYYFHFDDLDKVLTRVKNG
jgi:nucleotidyltransferase substrate binding protein (TIGR01987 family)